MTASFMATGHAPQPNPGPALASGVEQFTVLASLPLAKAHCRETRSRLGPIWPRTLSRPCFGSTPAARACGFRSRNPRAP